MYTEDFIEYWGDVFVALELRLRTGITFEAFLSNAAAVFPEGRR